MREKILNDMKQAMKNQDKELLTVIRMVKGSIQMEELKTKKELNDDEVTAIISREIKTRKESINEFRKGNREDLITKTEAEIELLNRYMPKQLTEEELNTIIDEVFNKVNPSGPSDIGKIMGQIAPLIKGKADLGLVNNLIKDKLNAI